GLVLNDAGKLAELVREAAQVRFHNHRNTHIPTPGIAASASRDIAVVAIGSSTGGVEALQLLLSSFPADCPPTLIVQHVNPRFAPAIARTLDASSPATVQIAEPNMRLSRGNIYLAPGDDRHLLLSGSGGAFQMLLRTGKPDTGHLPSVNVLFESVARAADRKAVGILLTGMGTDGARGLLAMAQAGAHTIAQDEASCVVFGMPRAAIALGAARQVMPLDSIARHALTQRVVTA
ncbi:MAG: CheB methylesterase domain-containing protein, partial [Novosphingobium sp.]